MTEATQVDVCVIACADAWRDDVDMVGRASGVIPTIAVRLARATTNRELMLFDPESSTLAAEPWPLGEMPTSIEGWLPYRALFELAWAGRGHIMMSPAQLDRYGNANLAAIGEPARPTRQLLGVCGAPGNSVTNATSYWLPRHTPRHLVRTVDVVCGVGHDSARAAGGAATRFQDLRRVVTELGTFDFGGPDRTLRLVGVHPGVDPAMVDERTGFEVPRHPSLGVSRVPTDDELGWITRLDPRGVRHAELRTDARSRGM